MGDIWFGVDPKEPDRMRAFSKNGPCTLVCWLRDTLHKEDTREPIIYSPSEFSIPPGMFTAKGKTDEITLFWSGAILVEPVTMQVYGSIN